MLDKNNGMTIREVIALQMTLSEENQSQSIKQTIQPNQIGQVAQSQLNSITPRSLSATRGIEHKIDIPRLGPTKIDCLDSLSFIAILRKVMDLGRRVNTVRHTNIQKARNTTMTSFIMTIALKFLTVDGLC